jgi:hypothetical protein
VGRGTGLDRAACRTGYPGFTADSSWTPLLKTPSHPEYVSGHQVTVGAILEVLIKTLGGKDQVSRTAAGLSAGLLCFFLASPLSFFLACENAPC